MEKQLTDSASLRSPRGAAADFIAASEADELDLHSLLILHHGSVVAEAYRAPFDADTPHRMYSVTKSFTASAIGLAIADGLLTVEDRVVEIFPDLAPHPIDQHLAELRIKHLLTMSAEQILLFRARGHRRRLPRFLPRSSRCRPEAVSTTPAPAPTCWPRSSRG